MPCTFRERGFLFDNGESAIPCGTIYHSKCLRSGAPFRTRLANDKGLCFPKCHPGLFPNFICEACQVRAHLGRELVDASPDLGLLMLERQRTLDVMHYWAESTVGTYSGHYRKLRDFHQVFGVSPLKPTPLLAPPTSPSIPVMWTQLLYSVQPSKSRSALQEPGAPVTFNTSRSVRSAAALFYAWDHQQSYPGQCVDVLNKPLVVPRALPTDELTYTLQQKGMARRMGTAVKPSWTLQFKHVKYIDDRLEQSWESASSDEVRNEVAVAGAANAMLYTSWMRGGEQFAVKEDDVANHGPETGPIFGLSEGTGHVALKMLLETKSSPTQQADIVVARTCASGISLGKWLDRVEQFPSRSEGGHLFSTPQRKVWNSRYFREKYAWRLLEDMRAEGEPSLMAFTDEPGHRIRDRIWSCHSWRRCSESTVARRRTGINFRKATEAEQYEHARWRRRNQAGKERLDNHYTKMELEQRLYITSLCM